MPVGRWRTFLSGHTLTYTYVHLIERMTAQSAASVHFCARAHMHAFIRTLMYIYAQINVYIRPCSILHKYACPVDVLLSAHTRDSARILRTHACMRKRACMRTYAHTHTHTPAHHCVYMPKSMLINTCEPIECSTGSAGMCPYGMCVK